MSQTKPPIPVNHDDQHDDHTETTPLKLHFVLYKTRWLMLFLFCMLSFSNAILWITYAPIASLVMDRYNVGAFAVNSLSLIFMILYIPFVFVASWIIDSKFGGLRVGVISGSVLNVLGAWIRVAGYQPNELGFAINFVGQSIAALAQTFILGVPPKVAANWFGEHERATATSIGALCNQLGVAIGFLMSPLIAKKEEDITLLLLVQAILCSVIGVFTIIFMREKPPTVPSQTAAETKTDFKLAVKAILKEPNFLILLFSFGIGIGAFYAVSTMLAFIIKPAGYDENDAGILGFLFVAVGLAGAITAGVIADKTRKYKLLIFLTFVGTLGALAFLFLSVRPHNLGMLIASCCFLGLFTTAILPLCLEAGVEVTYPVPEGISAGCVMMSAQVFGILFIIAMTFVTEYYEDQLDYANWSLVGCVLLSCVMMVFFKEDYKRMEAEKHP
mmetsp:Transcript_3494/g.4814  ORF Transcript_3494/g.4814 Transcript_3494/m.4814 type:complete len:444 (+) Transcript_3494:1752-3083(+)